MEDREQLLQSLRETTKVRIGAWGNQTKEVRNMDITCTIIEMIVGHLVMCVIIFDVWNYHPLH